MSFEAIRGQEEAVAALRRAAAEGRVPSAWLFLGPHHVGKRTAALALAQALNCRAGGADGCGACPPCRKIAEGVHPDVLTVRPDGQFIRIAQVRAVTDALGLVPAEARRRVVILAQADRMNAEAANALLKTLEEPPANTLLVLCAERTAALPETIVSRCVPVRFRLLDDAAVRDILAAAGVPPAALDFAVLFAQGRLRPALFGGAARWQSLRDEVLAALEPLSAAAYDEASRRIAKWSEGEDWRFVLEWLETWFHDLAVQDGAPAAVVNRDRLPALAAWRARFPERRALACYRAVLETRGALALNANKPLALEALWVTLKRNALQGAEGHG